MWVAWVAAVGGCAGASETIPAPSPSPPLAVAGGAAQARSGAVPSSEDSAWLSGEGLPRRNGAEERRRVWLRVRNASRREVCFLYVAPVGQRSWGPDQLRGRALLGGASGRYTLPVGRWDVRAEDCNHAELFVVSGAVVAEDATLVLHE